MALPFRGLTNSHICMYNTHNRKPNILKLGELWKRVRLYHTLPASAFLGQEFPHIGPGFFKYMFGETDGQSQTMLSFFDD